MRRTTLILALQLGLSACYHATIVTGLGPSPQTLENRWASGWIYGLVPPSTVETMARCPTGVARVETQLSFANQLVSFLTLGIYTPMEIVVTCAAARGDTEDSVVDNAADFRTALKGGKPFIVEPFGRPDLR